MRRKTQCLACALAAVLLGAPSLAPAAGRGAPMLSSEISDLSPAGRRLNLSLPWGKGQGEEGISHMRAEGWSIRLDRTRLPRAAPPTPPLPVPDPRRRGQPTGQETGHVPLPVPDPRRGEEPPPPKVWSPAEIAHARAACTTLLAGVAARWRFVTPIRKGPCGAPAPVRLMAVGSEISVRITPPATVDCAMVAALASWLDKAIQPLARAKLGAAVVSIHNVASYACRRRNGSATGRFSEHAFANALDVAGFEIAKGGWVRVAAHWGPTRREVEAGGVDEMAREARERSGDGSGDGPIRGERGRAPATEVPPPPIPRPVLPAAGSPAQTQGSAVADLAKPDPKTTFLHAAHRAACGVFGTVLGPEANAAHADHFHLDLAKRRHNAYCQ